MLYNKLSAHLFALALTAAIMGACSDANDPTAMTPEGPAFASSGPVLVECPVDYSITATGTVGATGGAIHLGNHNMAVPALAVTTPENFRITAPVSNYMELAVTAEGQSSFTFKKPVEITIDYSRCTRSNIDKAPLSVWYIDAHTNELLENLGGVDDKEARTVTFTTDHLSNFSIAQ